MPADLPTPIATYIGAANRGETEALGNALPRARSCGMKAKRSKAWPRSRNGWLETRQKYQHTIEPLASTQKDGKTIVTNRLTGNFPGSPIELEFVFTLERGKIAALEILS
jgi:hypothetical protein